MNGSLRLCSPAAIRHRFFAGRPACEYIDLMDEVLPGIPYGAIRGGAFDGISIVTKSGGFGAPDALIQVAEYFSCPN